MFCDKPLSTLRLLHYPQRNGEPPKNAARTKDGKIIAVDDHCDTEFLTLLTTFGHGGLEILDNNGDWQPVPPRPESLMVNIGDTFSSMMGGRFKAVRHRVVDLGIERYSAAFFLAPSYDVDVGFDIMKKARGETTNLTEQPFGPFLFRKMKYEKKYPEFKDLPDE
ncbi:hypothetical protein KUTeg_008756 [Tegillarca granosa]|nr:hypothetical protein KUTeg_008756 [Tegillarca granosa]